MSERWIILPDDADGVGRRPTGRPPRRRAPAVALAGAILIGALAGTWWWRASRYAGTAQRVTVSWTCAAALHWTDPDRGIGWREVRPDTQGAIVKGDPAPTSSTPIPPGLVQMNADGTMTFTSEDEAFFRSDAGGTARFVREPDGVRPVTSCPGT